VFFIPGFLVALLTFPGVIVHEIAHRVFCDLAKVPVYRAVYFRLGDPSGYVVHGPVPDLKSAFLIAVGPFFINSFVCALICFSVLVPVLILKDYALAGTPLSLFQLWLGISIGMHAFPSKQDLDNFHAQIKAGKGITPLRVFSASMRIAFSLARLASFFWFDAIYAVGISMIVPTILCGI